MTTSLRRSRILFGLALLAWAGVSAAWIRSHYRWDLLARSSPGRFIEFSSCRGQIAMGRSWGSSAAYFNTVPRNAGWFRQSIRPVSPSFPYPTFLGFTYGREHPVRAIGGNFRIVAIPWWFVWLLVSGLVTLARRRLVRVQRERRQAAEGLCAACGYDLRGSTERCPECGRPIAAAETPFTEPKT